MTKLSAISIDKRVLYIEIIIDDFTCPLNDMQTHRINKIYKFSSDTHFYVSFEWYRTKVFVLFGLVWFVLYHHTHIQIYAEHNQT